MENYAVTVFPSNECEALAMLYMNHLDLNGKTPEELAKIYTEALARVRKQLEELNAPETRWL